MNGELSQSVQPSVRRWGEACLKRFILRFSIALGVFAVANVISVFTRSDDLFTPDTPDAMTRFGFPL